MRLCLVDVCESLDPGTNDSVICLFGRLESGESACVVVHEPEYSIHVAIARDWDWSTLQYDLTQELRQWNGQIHERDEVRQSMGIRINRRYAPCTRTLCPCKHCRVCDARDCICVCKKCRKDPCTCYQVQQVEINHDPCVADRRADRHIVRSVEVVEARGFIGYEEHPRLFAKIVLSRSCYLSPAKKYLAGLDTGLPELQAGVFGETKGAVDAFMQAKTAAGFGWLDVEGTRPVVIRQSRCTHEVACVFSDVRRAEEQPPPANMTRLCLDIETLAEARFTNRDPIGMVALRTESSRVLLAWGTHFTGAWGGGWEVRLFPGERELLRHLMGFITEADPDFITGAYSPGGAG